MPACLKKYYVPELSECSMTEIMGSICCSCGEKAFRALSSEEPGLRYSLKCLACGQDILLFDARRHGWDALVCGDVPDGESGADQAEACEKCGGDAFRAEVWIEHIAREEFVSDIPEGLTEDDWVNAHGWFGASLTCDRCGRQIRSWADVETA